MHLSTFNFVFKDHSVGHHSKMVGQDTFQFKKELISCQIVAVGNNAAASYVKTKTT